MTKYDVRTNRILDLVRNLSLAIPQIQLVFASYVDLSYKFLYLEFIFLKILFIFFYPQILDDKFIIIRELTLNKTLGYSSGSFIYSIPLPRRGKIFHPCDSFCV